MLRDRAFDQFRKLLVINDIRFTRIDQAAFDTAVAGLTEDQRAFAQVVFNTINSTHIHTVEYVHIDSSVSKTGTALAKHYMGSIASSLVIKWPDNLLAGVRIANMWGSATFKTDDGSYSILIEGLTPKQAGDDYLNTDNRKKEGNPAGIPAMAGHEVYGHGRFLSINPDEAKTLHVHAIRMENLILRVMGFTNIQRTGEGHAMGTRVVNASALPEL
jgi:hypothetical protein